VLVAAAGNQAQPAENYEPASCPGVIAVGATDARGYRSGYSNHGPRVDLYAPGGSLARDDNQDGSPDGILSLGWGLAVALPTPTPRAPLSPRPM